MKIVKWLLIAVGILVLVVLAGYAYASFRVGRIFEERYETHAITLPVPWPLTDDEIAALNEPGVGGGPQAAAESGAPDLDAIALERAQERGRHLLDSRYVCKECHGQDLSGGVMIDDAAIGRIYGPNLTRGRGSVTTNYTTTDWDRMVRHGVKPDGTATVMPSHDFLTMSDRELSDIIAYIRSVPPVDNVVAPVSFGSLGKVLLATGQIPLTADAVDHQAPHAVLPPEPTPTAEFGAHLAQVCTGCHGEEFTGGPIAGGPPSWAPAANLTPHESGLAGWTYEQFETAMRRGLRPDGTRLRTPMDAMIPFSANMTDTELRALYTYLQSLPPQPSP